MMHSEWLEWLLRSALASTLAIILVLALRGIWLRRLGAISVLWLWLLVPALVVAVSVPARMVQVMAPIESTFDAGIVAADRNPLAIASRLQLSATIEQPDSARFFTRWQAHAAEWELAAFLIWLWGAVALAFRLLSQQRGFLRGLGRLRAREDGSWIAATSDFGPVVVGLVRPRIVVPADFELRYDARQQRLILAHERCHLSRGDLQVNFMLCVLRCLYWFNPLVHMAARRLRFDQELACDATVMLHFPHSRRAYADAILNTQLADLGLPVGCYWQSSHPLKWRIIMLTKPNASMARVILGSGLAILGSTLAAVTAWAALPERIEMQPVAIAVAETGSHSARPVVALDAAAYPEPGVAAIRAARVVAPAPVIQPRPEPLPMPVIVPAPVVDAVPAVNLVPAVEVVPVIQSSPVIIAAEVPANVVRPMLAALNSARVDTVHSYVVGALQATVQVAPESADVPAEKGTEAAYDEIELPILLAIDKPRYPRIAGRLYSNRNGQVIVSVALDAEGRPTDVAIAESNLSRAYEKSAMNVVKDARFAPAKKNGVSVSCTALVPVEFSQDNFSKFMTGSELNPLIPPQMHKPRFYSQRPDVY